MNRVQRLYLRLWILVFGLLTFEAFHEINKVLPKEQVVDYHVMRVSIPLLNSITNRGQLAAVIGHEFGHLILGHTRGNTHEAKNEYHSDMIGMHLARKAGYDTCGIERFWYYMGAKSMSLHSGSHPNPFIRSYYLTMPECQGKAIKVEAITVADAREVFRRVAQGVEGKYKHNTLFSIDYDLQAINAYVYTVTKDKE